MRIPFFSWPVQKRLPKEIQIGCDALRNSPNQEIVLRRAYDLVSGRFRARRSRTYILIHKILSRDAERVWSRTNFLHCTHMNWILKILLVGSGWFKEADVSEHWAFVWYCSPHQYLRVRMHNGHEFAVDPWARTYGVPFGKYARSIPPGCQSADDHSTNW